VKKRDVAASQESGDRLIWVYNVADVQYLNRQANPNPGVAKTSKEIACSAFIWICSSYLFENRSWRFAKTGDEKGFAGV
jgi:hypothetical protein